MPEADDTTKSKLGSKWPIFEGSVFTWPPTFPETGVTNRPFAIVGLIVFVYIVNMAYAIVPRSVL